jgi:4-hydroxy-tetrahydrodipicolinate reductase
MESTMTRIAIHGAAGRMGRSIARVLAEDPRGEVTAAVDRGPTVGQDLGLLAGLPPSGLLVSADLEAAFRGADVVIDFSLPTATRGVMEAAAEAGIPVVCGTTGLDAGARAALDALSKTQPIVVAPNFSQGVTLLFHLAARAAELLGEGFDAEIVEMHHRMKVDSPSGTAMKLAEVVAEAKGLAMDEHAVYGREGQVGARPSQEIAVLALRGGDVVGEHTLYLQGMGERLELSHRATDRQIFARGAVRAAHWVKGKTPGIYDMFDVMGVSR